MFITIISTFKHQGVISADGQSTAVYGEQQVDIPGGAGGSVSFSLPRLFFPLIPTII